MDMDMGIYKYTQMDDDILLEKIILDTNQYTIINKINGDILLKKIKNIDIFDDQILYEIKNYDFKNSNIISCSLNNECNIKLKYKSILSNIYEIIDDGVKIIKLSKLNIKTIEKKNEGFYYLKKLGISIQRVESNKCLFEIVNQCIENKIKLTMQIKLNNNILINIKN